MKIILGQSHDEHVNLVILWNWDTSNLSSLSHFLDSISELPQ